MKFKVQETVILIDPDGHFWRIGDEVNISLPDCTVIGGEIRDLSTREIVIKSSYIDEPIKIRLDDISQVDEY